MILKFIPPILTIYDRSDYLSVIQENLDKKTQSDLSLQESYDFCEKKSKSICNSNIQFLF